MRGAGLAARVVALPRVAAGEARVEDASGDVASNISQALPTATRTSTPAPGLCAGARHSTPAPPPEERVAATRTVPMRQPRVKAVQSFPFSAQLEPFGPRPHSK